MKKKLPGQVLLAAALSLGVAIGSSLLTPAAFAQNSTTGSISGVVSDSSGAVLPGATVTITQVGNDVVITVKADKAGRYSAGLLKPGKYTVSAASENFTSDTIDVFVALSQATPVDIKMVPAGNKAVVEVSAESVPLIDTQNISLITTLTETQIANLPSPGGDVTTVAFTAPGVVVNAGGAYGNFSSFGLPGVSNLFVLNGFDNQDPFLNLNNSGSSNLTLGAGELSEVSIVQNGYSSQYGRAAGAIINYTTKSGTNGFHGTETYFNNTSVINANGWFANQAGAARPHAVSNQWAANVGGPIIKDKAFFFADYEGLRYVLPGASGYVNFPSPQLQTYILSQVPAQSLSLYQQAFATYQSAPSYASAVPVTNGTGPAQDDSAAANGVATAANPVGFLGCGQVFNGTPTGTGGTFGLDTPCITTAYGSANNINKEYLFTFRGDYKVSQKQDIYARYKVDHGSQPTSTSFINPLFNAVSIQPEDEGQFNDNYRFTPNTVNSFTIAANWYSAYFGPANNAASAAVFPYYFTPDGGEDFSGTNSASGLTTFGAPYYLTQGRDVTQYQVEDDFNYIHGRNTIKAGFNFRRDDVTDYDSEILTIFPLAYFASLGDFASGTVNPNSTLCFSGAAAGDCYGSSGFVQAFSQLQHAHLALYNIGIYLQDEMQASSKLKLTFGARIDRTGNPLCNDNCFSQYKGTFPAAGASLTTPYISSSGGPITASNPHAYPSTQAINFQPRFGFNYSPVQHTEIRGGVGWFSDLYPAGFLDGAIENFPNDNVISVVSGVFGASGAGSLQANAIAANSAIVGGFAAGQNLTQINNTLNNQGVPFSPPAIGAYFPGEFKVPEYVEYSLQVQQQVGRKDAIILTYAGNYGYNEVITDPYTNAASGSFNTGGAAGYNAGAYQIGGLATAPPDPSFSSVNSYTNNAHSNYNGGVVTWKHDGHGLTTNLNYTWSHGFDECSNGCIGEPFNGGSLAGQLTPNLHVQNLNYSNSDYDVRNNLSGDLVYEEPRYFKNTLLHSAGDGWIVGIKTYYRGGVPFSATTSSVTGFPLAPVTLPDLISAKATNKCTSNPHLGTTTGCLDQSDFLSNNDPTAGLVQTDFGNFPRNSLRSPHYADTDLNVNKVLFHKEKLTFELGGTAYNAFNHPNFAAPSGNVTGGSTFGHIYSTLSAPTSPYGSFQGNAVTQRLVTVNGKFTF